MAQMQDIGRIVRHLPVLGQVGLDKKLALSHLRPDRMPREPVVDEAQRHVRLNARGPMQVKVHRLRSP